METLGQRIKRLRATLGLSQPELAAVVRVDHITLSRWETDKRTPRSPAIRRALADALGVTVPVLMEGEHATSSSKALHDAAPSLLEALEAVLRLLPDDLQDRVAAHKARAAIKQAKGGS